MAETATSKPTPRYEGQSERVNHPTQVIALLRRLRDTHTLLTVAIPGSERQFNSMVLDVNAEQGYLLLDELNNPQGHQLLAETGRLRAHGRCQGVQLNFACTVKVARARDGGIVYQAPLPEYIVYLQRRAAFRVPVGLGLGMELHLPVPDAGVVHAQPCDISIMGVGARTDDPGVLEPELVLPDCTLHLPDHELINLTLEIRYVQPDTHPDQYRFGARFVELEPRQKTQLRRVVTHMEREMLRRGTR